MKDPSRKHPDAWPLSAEQLDGLVVDLLGKVLSTPESDGRIVEDASTADITGFSSNLLSIQRGRECLSSVERVDLKPRNICILISGSKIADLLRVEKQRVKANELQIEASFQMRRRDVEPKLHLGDAPPEIDRFRIQNTVKAQRWMDMILDGKSFAEIAEGEKTSKRRVQDVVDLAMLAPDLLGAISCGESTGGLTSDYLI